MTKKIMTVFGVSFFVLTALFCVDRGTVLAEGASPAAYKTSVSRVTLSKTLYAQNETVNGSFTLANSGSEDVSDLYYRVLIVGGFDKDGIAEYVYSQSDLKGPLSILGNKTTSVPFSYILPSYVGGNDVGVKIELLTKQGQLLYLSLARFDVSGSMSAVNIQGTSIKIGDQTFDPQTGVTIHLGESPYIVVGVLNPLADSVTLTPRIKIYDRVTTGSPLYTETSNAKLTISAKTEKTVSYKLPLFANKPGVYAGTIDFIDSTGSARSALADFRYIIGGDIATIQSVNFGSGSVAKGQVVDVSVLYAGSPIDIRTYDNSNGVKVGTSTLSVSLFNEKGELVGKATSVVDVNDVQTEIVKIASLADSRALRADVVLSKNGKALSSLSTDFVPALNLLSEETTAEGSTFQRLLNSQAMLISIGVLLLGLLLWLIAKISRGSSMTAIVIIGLIVAVMSAYLAIRIVTDFIYTKTADAATYTIPDGYVGPGGWVATSWFGGKIEGKVLLPLDNVNLSVTPSASSLSPGEKFSLEASIKALQCSNADQHVKLYIQSISWDSTFVPATYSKNNHKAPCGGECFRYTTTGFSAGSYTAPSTPGDYKITFKITDNWPGSTPSPASLEGYINITVVSPVSGSDSDNSSSLSGNSNSSSTTSTYSCSIPTPANATLCDGSSSGLAANTSSTVVNSCGSTKCSYLCNSGYVKEGNVCVSEDDASRGICAPYTDESGNKPATFANINQPVTWRTKTTGGDVYSWTGSVAAGTNPTGMSYTISYPTIGNRSVSLKISSTTPYVPCTTAQNGLPNGLPIVNNPNYQPF